MRKIERRDPGWVGAALLVLMALSGQTAAAADRDRCMVYLEAVSYDHFLRRDQLEVMSGTGLGAQEAARLGAAFVATAEAVFDPELVAARTLERMVSDLPDEMLEDGIAFAMTDLAQRVMAGDTYDDPSVGFRRLVEYGAVFVADYRANNPERLRVLEAMIDATGLVDMNVDAGAATVVAYEIAAEAAGMIAFSMPEPEVRRAIRQDWAAARARIRDALVAVAAYSYRHMDDDEIHRYGVARQDPQLRRFMAAFNEIRTEVTVERYETLAADLAKIDPDQD